MCVVLEEAHLQLVHNLGGGKDALHGGCNMEGTGRLMSVLEWQVGPSGDLKPRLHWRGLTLREQNMPAPLQRGPAAAGPWQLGFCKGRCRALPGMPCHLPLGRQPPPTCARSLRAAPGDEQRGRSH